MACAVVACTRIYRGVLLDESLHRCGKDDDGEGEDNECNENRGGDEPSDDGAEASHIQLVDAVW